MDRPNVVIIMADEQKVGALPFYGNPLVRAPYLTALAAGGARFDQAYVTCPLCVPARVSLMTGRFPHTTGSRTNLFLMPPGERHLFDIMREHGYRTGLVGKNHCFQPPDLAQLDELWEAGHLGPYECAGEAAAARQWIIDSGVAQRAWGAERNPYSADVLGTALTTDHALEFVERHRREPFFLWYSIADPHTPLQTPSPYAEMYRPEEIPLPPQDPEEMENKPPAQQIDYRALAGDKVTPEIMQQALAIYYGMNTYVDDQVGRFLAGLHSLGLAEDTIVIYLSDHGDYMGEHSMIRKSKALYDCLCRVPLIVSWPGTLRPQVSDAFVCLEDILPTLMDLLGWPVPAGVQGRSLGGLLSGTGYEPRTAIHGEHGLEGDPYTLADLQRVPAGPLTRDFSPNYKLGTRGRCASVRTRRWKLVHYPEQPYGELYDLQEDPWELCNLYGLRGYDEVRHELRSRLLDWLIETEDCLPAPPQGDDMGG